MESDRVVISRELGRNYRTGEYVSKGKGITDMCKMNETAKERICKLEGRLEKVSRMQQEETEG